MAETSKKIDRDTELSTRKRIADKLLKLYADIEEGFRDQAPRSDEALDYWDAYYCQLGGNQFYNGNSTMYVPSVHNAVNARATRFVNQLFPRGGRYVDVVSANGDQPHGETALLEHYVRKGKMRTDVAVPLVVNGDIEGQYNVYCAWSSVARHVAWKEKKPVKVEGVDLPPELDDGVDEMMEDVILEDRPVVEVLPDADVLIMPATCDTVEEALEVGGSVTIIRRWTKAQMEKMIADGDVDEEAGEAVIKEMAKAAKVGWRDPKKHHADAAGVKSKGKVCLGYETWKKLKVPGHGTRLCKILYGTGDIVLSCKINPYWSDRCPLISRPVKKVAGVVKGISQIQPVAKLQYAANDFANLAMDSATYAMLPIIMTDPEKNPRVNTMILDLAAIWEVDPNSTKAFTFPSLYEKGFEIVGVLENKIFQTLSVNPAMMPQSTGGKSKRNQAEIANEQQVDILTTHDAVTVLEEGIFTPILERFAEYDAQFRQEDITIKAFGQMGMRASMEQVPPLQMGRRYEFLWFGVEQARNAAQLQQQTSMINVLRGIPPQLLPGRRLNLVPAVEHAVAAMFGSRIAPLIFEDLSKQHSMPPEEENEILDEGHAWPVSPSDDDMAHMQVHIANIKEKGDPSGNKRAHVFQHRMAQMQKAQAQQGGEGAPGTPGGGGQPGVAGVPRPGGQAAGPRQGKGPNGSIAPESMGRAGAVTMPRKF